MAWKQSLCTRSVAPFSLFSCVGAALFQFSFGHMFTQICTIANSALTAFMSAHMFCWSFLRGPVACSSASPDSGSRAITMEPRVDMEETFDMLESPPPAPPLSLCSTVVISMAAPSIASACAA
jgi:hypothetical protein